MKALPRRAAAKLAIALVGATVFAHEGEEHGEARPVPASTPAAVRATYTLEGSSDLFELLVKLPEKPSPGRESEASAYLTDASTNEAIADATIELAVSGPASASMMASPTDAAGVYRLTLPGLSAGAFDV